MEYRDGWRDPIDHGHGSQNRLHRRRLLGKEPGPERRAELAAAYPDAQLTTSVEEVLADPQLARSPRPRPTGTGCGKNCRQARMSRSTWLACNPFAHSRHVEIEALGQRSARCSVMQLARIKYGVPRILIAVATERVGMRIKYDVPTISVPTITVSVKAWVTVSGWMGQSAGKLAWGAFNFYGREKGEVNNLKFVDLTPVFPYLSCLCLSPVFLTPRSKSCKAEKTRRGTLPATACPRVSDGRNQR